MSDRESVITHLQIIHTWAEFARKRDLQFFTAKHLDDIAQWSDDALNLLKELNNRLMKKQKDVDKLCEEISIWKHRFHEKTEIIRCKDCFYGEVEPDDNSYFFCTHPLHKLESHESSCFCADGEQRG